MGMLIEAVKQPREGYPAFHIAVKSVKWCCERMGVAWLLCWASFGDSNFQTINQLAKVRILPPVGKPFGAVGIIIDLCPYCGEKIEVSM